LSRSKLSPPVSTLSGSALVDLPLRSDEESLSHPDPESRVPEGESGVGAAGLGARAAALGADAATILLLAFATVLGARALTGELPSTAGLPWVGAFLLLLSFFTTVLSLLLFGKTVGMALAGLTVGPRASSRRMRAGEAIRRWLGTLVTAATLGLPLLWTGQDGGAPTPADRWSGRSLVQDEVES
jgi:RDD family protein